MVLEQNVVEDERQYKQYTCSASTIAILIMPALASQDPLYLDCEAVNCAIEAHVLRYSNANSAKLDAACSRLRNQSRTWLCPNSSPN
jgi:hypothetical protein